MTVAAFAEAHAAFARARETTAPWLAKLRTSGIERFLAHGLPTRQHEEWKYTSLKAVSECRFAVPGLGTAAFPPEADAFLKERVKPLVDAADVTLVFVDGVLSTGLSKLPPLCAGIRVRTLSDAATALGDQMSELLGPEPATWADHPFAALTQAFLDLGTVVEVDKGIVADRTIHIIHVATTQDAALFPRTVVKLAPLAEARVVETFVGAPGTAYLVASRVELALGQGASLVHVKTQIEGDLGLHAGLGYARLARDAKLYTYAHMQGGRLIRNDLAIDLDGAGAEVTLDGLYLTRGKEHVDNHTLVDHKVPGTTSSQTYKGVLCDASRAVFNGRVFVRKDAQQTNAHQLNGNLLLSSDAEVDTKPELQIDANDVKCAHGATVGQLRQGEIFYLQSRGLSRDRAMAMLSAAFADEVVLKLPHEAVVRRLRGLTKEWFAP
jgi:Fe-S cluster assembly protein SufD